MKIGDGSKIYETAKIVDSGSWGSAEIEIGKNCLICDFTFIGVKKLIMREGSQIGLYASIHGGGEVTLGKYSVVGYGVRLISGSDSTSAKYMCDAAQPSEREVLIGSITLGEGAYIGTGAVICVSKKCPDIEIGDFSVVGALSYIDSSVPNRTIIHPRKDYVIKKRWNEK